MVGAVCGSNAEPPEQAALSMQPRPLLILANPADAAFGVQSVPPPRI